MLGDNQKVMARKHIADWDAETHSTVVSRHAVAARANKRYFRYTTLYGENLSAVARRFMF